MAQLAQQMLDIWAKTRETIRYVFYRMTATNLREIVQKTDNGYDQVQSLAVKLRDIWKKTNGREGLDPSRVIDSSRSGIYLHNNPSARDRLEHAIADDGPDPWKYSEHYVQVWCETRSVAGVLEEVCRPFALNLFPSGGFPSNTFLDEAADLINESGKLKVFIPYAGDYDDHGLLIDKGKKGIETKLRERLRPEIKLTFKRIAVTAEQIKKYKLPTKLAKKNNLHKKVKNTVEVETMRAATLQGLLRREIERLLPKDAMALAEKEAERETRKLEGLLKYLPG